MVDFSTHSPQPATLQAWEQACKLAEEACTLLHRIAEYNEQHAIGSQRKRLHAIEAHALKRYERRSQLVQQAMDNHWGRL
jgi:hypothetical protein